MYSYVSSFIVGSEWTDTVLTASAGSRASGGSNGGGGRMASVGVEDA